MAGCRGQDATDWDTAIGSIDMELVANPTVLLKFPTFALQSYKQARIDRVY
jgi:hypothetical protein